MNINWFTNVVNKKEHTGQNDKTDLIKRLMRNILGLGVVDEVLIKLGSGDNMPQYTQQKHWDTGRYTTVLASDISWYLTKESGRIVYIITKNYICSYNTQSHCITIVNTRGNILPIRIVPALRISQFLNENINIQKCLKMVSKI